LSNSQPIIQFDLFFQTTHYLPMLTFNPYSHLFTTINHLLLSFFPKFTLVPLFNYYPFPFESNHFEPLCLPLSTKTVFPDDRDAPAVRAGRQILTVLCSLPSNLMPIDFVLREATFASDQGQFFPKGNLTSDD
jgi:hypothetical protein